MLLGGLVSASWACDRSRVFALTKVSFGTLQLRARYLLARTEVPRRTLLGWVCRFGVGAMKPRQAVETEGLIGGSTCGVVGTLVTCLPDRAAFRAILPLEAAGACEVTATDRRPAVPATRNVVAWVLHSGAAGTKISSVARATHSSKTRLATERPGSASQTRIPLL